jgi:hypothetical protein
LPRIRRSKKEKKPNRFPLGLDLTAGSGLKKCAPS